MAVVESVLSKIEKGGSKMRFRLRHVTYENRLWIDARDVIKILEATAKKFNLADGDKENLNKFKAFVKAEAGKKA